MTKIYVAFHIGRGGSFNNAGHRTFIGEMTFAELVQKRSQYLFESNRDENGKFCKPYIHDGNGNFVTHDDFRKGLTGTLEFDTIYDTDIVKEISNCEDWELEVIQRDRGNHTISNDLKTYLENTLV